MLSRRGRLVCVVEDRFPEFDLCSCTDPAQHLRRAGKELEDLDLSDLLDEWNVEYKLYIKGILSLYRGYIYLPCRSDQICTTHIFLLAYMSKWTAEG